MWCIGFFRLASNEDCPLTSQWPLWQRTNASAPFHTCQRNCLLIQMLAPYEIFFTYSVCKRQPSAGVSSNWNILPSKNGKAANNFCRGVEAVNRSIILDELLGSSENMHVLSKCHKGAAIADVMRRKKKLLFVKGTTFYNEACLHLPQTSAASGRAGDFIYRCELFRSVCAWEASPNWPFCLVLAISLSCLGEIAKTISLMQAHRGRLDTEVKKKRNCKKLTMGSAHPIPRCSFLLDTLPLHHFLSF